MNDYTYKATNLIAETFTARDIKFDVVNIDNLEILQAGFPINCGPSVIVRFISKGNGNDVTVSILGLVANIPQDKRVRVMEACNLLNRTVRYLKFFVDTNGALDIDYDLPLLSHDACVGEMAFELFFRIIRALDSEYGLFMKALYTDENLYES